jgi:uncharacterized protein YjbJ (UPF0337 family)
LPYGRQDLHITTLLEARISTFCSHTFSFGPQSALGGGEVKDDDFIGCSSGVILARWWGVGIFSLAPVVERLRKTINQMKPSTKDQVKGKLDELKGNFKEKAGQVTNNANLATKGQNEKLAGKVQKKVGQVEEVFEK